jgi:hypothetical protein
MRITIIGRRWETSAWAGVDPDKWDSNKENARGSYRNSYLDNETIDNARYKIQKS